MVSCTDWHSAFVVRTDEWGQNSPRESTPIIRALIMHLGGTRDKRRTYSGIRESHSLTTNASPRMSCHSRSTSSHEVKNRGSRKSNT